MDEFEVWLNKRIELAKNESYEAYLSNGGTLEHVRWWGYWQARIAELENVLYKYKEISRDKRIYLE